VLQHVNVMKKAEDMYALLSIISMTTFPLPGNTHTEGVSLCYIGKPTDGLESPISGPPY
jgi:hypothetical protein